MHGSSFGVLFSLQPTTQKRAMAPLRGLELAKLFDGQVSLEFIGDGVRPWRLRAGTRGDVTCGEWGAMLLSYPVKEHSWDKGA